MDNIDVYYDVIHVFTDNVCPDTIIIFADVNFIWVFLSYILCFHSRVLPLLSVPTY